MRLILLTVSALVAAILAGCARGPSDPNVPGGATAQISGVSPDLRSLQDAEGMADSVAVRNKLRARPGELLVRFKPRTSAETIQAVLSKQSLSATRSFRSIPGLRLVKLSAATSTDVAQADYAASPEVLYAEPNYIQVLQSVPDDPQFSSQWGLHNTGQTGNAADVDI